MKLLDFNLGGEMFPKKLFYLFILLFSVILVSCDDDDPIAPEEEHFEAEGMVFYDSGIEIARIHKGVTTDTLKAPEGEMSGHIDIKFIDHDDNIIDPPSDEGQTLTWAIDDETVAGIWQHEGEEGHFEFHLQGLEEGETMIEFFVTHGDHNDYRSGKIPVKIEHDDDHGHFEAEGMVFYDSGIEIARIHKGVTTDTLEAPEGGMSGHIDVKFIDHDNNIIDPPTGDEQTLTWNIDNESIAGIWQHEGEEGGFEFHLQGLEEGETMIEFFVTHDGHNDFRSGKIPVKVEHDDDHQHGPPAGYNLIDEESGDTLLTLNDQTVTGSLSVAANETSDHIEVEFFDANGTAFQPGVPEHSLVVESGDTNILAITGQDPNEPWAFKIQGVAAGTTTLTLKIMHDGSVGKSFVPINVTVN